MNAATKSDVIEVSCEDIQYLWDNPSAMPKNREGVLNIIKKSVNERMMPINEWNEDGSPDDLATKDSRYKKQEKPQPLFPKNPRKEPSSSALQDSIEL